MASIDQRRATKEALVAPCFLHFVQDSQENLFDITSSRSDYCRKTAIVLGQSAQVITWAFNGG